MKKIILIIILFITFSRVCLYLEKENTDSVVARTIPTEHHLLVDYWLNVYTNQYNIPREIMDGMAWHETAWYPENTNYNAFRVGDKGKSFGPLQIQLPTAKSAWVGINNIVVTSKKLRYDVKFNIETACRLMRQYHDDMSKKYKSEKDRWLAALTIYNMGLGKFIANNRRYNSYAKNIYNSYMEG